MQTPRPSASEYMIATFKARNERVSQPNRRRYSTDGNCVSATGGVGAAVASAAPGNYLGAGGVGA
jgi:hypothetical protein